MHQGFLIILYYANDVTSFINESLNDYKRLIFYLLKIFQQAPMVLGHEAAGIVAK